MAETVLENDIPVYSEKYDVHGFVRDYGVVTKLYFTYGGKQIEMGINNNPLKEVTFGELGRDIIESYISNLSANSDGRKLQLHYWYIVKRRIAGGAFCELFSTIPPSRLRCQVG